MEKILQCNCEDSTGNVTIRCCNICGLSTEAIWQPLMDFKKFSLLKDSHTVSTDNTLAAPSPVDGEKTAEEILMKNLPRDCFWEEMGNLTNTPIQFVLQAMTEYASLKVQQERNKTIQECKDALCKLAPGIESETTRGNVMWSRGRMRALKASIAELEKLKTPS